MKTFSKQWKASKSPGKQRKYVANAPLHIAQKMRGSPLASDLKKTYAKNALPARIGDTVTIMRGDHKGHSGEVIGFSVKDRGRVTIRGLEVSRRDGSKKNLSIHHSNLLVITRKDEKKRKARKQAADKKAAEKIE